MIQILEKTISQLVGSTVSEVPEVPMLQAGHKHRAMMLDPSAPGVDVEVYLQTRSGPPARLAPGDVLDICGGPSVYVRAVPTGWDLQADGTEDVDGTSKVRFVLFSECDTAGVGGKSSPKAGDRVAVFDRALSVSAGNDAQVWALPSTVPGLPLSIVCTVSGGALDTSGSSEDFPAELVLRERNQDGSTILRTWLCPGDGEAHLVIPVGLTRRYGSGTPRGWDLFVRNPAGSQAAKTVQIVGEVVAGHMTPAAVYRLAKKQTAENNTNRQTSFGFVSDKASVRGRVRNDGGSGTWEGRLKRYIPTAYGGPDYMASEAVSSDSSAEGALDVANDCPFWVYEGLWTTAANVAILEVLNP